MADRTVAPKTLTDFLDEIDKRLAQTLAIVDLLGASINPAELNSDTRNNASWIAKDLIRDTRELVTDLCGKVDVKLEVANHA